MKTRARKQWIAGAALGGMIVGSVALAGVAAADDEDITIGVDITSTEPEGALTLTVENDAVQLVETEDFDGEGLREFTGTLSGVSVSDTREDGGWWAVAVQSNPDDFQNEDGSETISSAYLGWEPRLVSGDGGGLVEAGEPIAGDLEENPDGWLDGGLQQGDLLVTADDGVQGTFEAAADLNLTVEDDVVPGSYTTTLTISLFEG